MEDRTIHHIPFRSDLTLQGLVNVKGQLKLCFSLNHILDINSEKPLKTDAKESLIYKRLLTLQKDDDQFLITVDETHGIIHVDKNNVENVPHTYATSISSFLKGIINWSDKKIGFLDEDLLFYALKRKLHD